VTESPDGGSLFSFTIPAVAALAAAAEEVPT
jgi:hypothetical protein